VLEEFLDWLIERFDAIDPWRHREASLELQAVIVYVERLVSQAQR
jgi:hypothetical protein